MDLTDPGPELKRRSLTELDEVIEEILEQHPDWVQQVTKIIEAHTHEHSDP